MLRHCSSSSSVRRFSTNLSVCPSVRHTLALRHKYKSLLSKEKHFTVLSLYSTGIYYLYAVRSDMVVQLLWSGGALVEEKE